MVVSSSHPQGWVPIETSSKCRFFCKCFMGSIHPQGWVPIETRRVNCQQKHLQSVAFTPKGGCPLKLLHELHGLYQPQWVAFTPKGGCPLKQTVISRCWSSTVSQ